MTPTTPRIIQQASLIMQEFGTMELMAVELLSAQLPRQI
jgi:hypothetical protein